MQPTIRFKKYVVMLIFLIKIVTLSYNQICSKILSKLEMILSHLYYISLGPSKPHLLKIPPKKSLQVDLATFNTNEIKKKIKKDRCLILLRLFC